MAIRNITDFVEMINSQNPAPNSYVTAYDIFKAVKDDEEMLDILCGAVVETYSNLQHIKKFME